MYQPQFRVSLCAVLGALLAGCGGSGGGSSPTPNAPTPDSNSVGAPVPVRSSPPVTSNAAAFACPTSGRASAVVQGPSSASDAVRRPVARGVRNAPAASDRIAVTYDRGALAGSRTALAARESNLGATTLRELDFPHAGLTTRILAVPAAQRQNIEAALRAQPGVKSVGPAGSRRYPTAVSGPFLTNDAYFRGFGPAPPAPYRESAHVPGQWDTHATRLEDAFAYSQPGNGSGITNPNALGSSSIKIAVIDSGEDATHPELRAKVAYQRCFITNSSGAPSTSNFSTDSDGHGTDVSGIAAAGTNNGLGFAGNGGNAALYAYRVLPTPDDNCLTPSTTDPQCGADSADIASAIEDAVAQKVNVINLSLGGGGCNTSGVDNDPAEGNAVNDAIAANVIVVAASGNDSAATVSAPACNNGVIAAGASALDDGQPNGSGVVRGTTAAPVEYVASYSDHGSPGVVLNSAAAWGIVAPGGDPVDNTDADDLHWIENIYTTTPFDAKFAGSCGPDFGTNSVPDCRVLIAGTSMASPTVAGAAALILAVNPGYQPPARMKQLLCATAHDIGDPNEGCGRLDIYRAMAAALGDPNPPSP